MELVKQEAHMGPAELRRLLEEYGLAVNKGLGQNFLVDEGILCDIVSAAGVTAKDTVLEIGPGPGVLTEKLLEAAGSVIAVELDKGMCRLLEERFGTDGGTQKSSGERRAPEAAKIETLVGGGKLRILHGDILKLDPEELYRDAGSPGGGLKVAANLPYYVTTPVIMHLLQKRELFQSITVMVQKEVAERMEAKPGSKSYGALSLAVQYAAKIRLDFTVPPSAFYPMPKVTSAVVTLTPYEKPPVYAASEENLFRLIRAAFGQRRKMLVNAAAGVDITPKSGKPRENMAGITANGSTHPESVVDITRDYKKPQESKVDITPESNKPRENMGDITANGPTHPESVVDINQGNQKLQNMAVDITQKNPSSRETAITPQKTTKPALEQALIRLGLDPKIRGEELSLEQFAALSNILTDGFPGHQESATIVP